MLWRCGLRAYTEEPALRDSETRARRSPGTLWRRHLRCADTTRSRRRAPGVRTWDQSSGNVAMEEEVVVTTDGTYFLMESGCAASRVDFFLRDPENQQEQEQRNRQHLCIRHSTIPQYRERPIAERQLSHTDRTPGACLCVAYIHQVHFNDSRTAVGRGGQNHVRHLLVPVDPVRSLEREFSQHISSHLISRQ
jgi:hypothetical protein